VQIWLVADLEKIRLRARVWGRPRYHCICSITAAAGSWQRINDIRILGQAVLLEVTPFKAFAGVLQSEGQGRAGGQGQLQGCAERSCPACHQFQGLVVDQCMSP
jgi:hypothetical protein